MIKKTKTGTYKITIYFNENGKSNSLSKNFSHRKAAERYELYMRLKKTGKRSKQTS